MYLKGLKKQYEAELQTAGQAVDAEEQWLDSKPFSMEELSYTFFFVCDLDMTHWV